MVRVRVTHKADVEEFELPKSAEGCWTELEEVIRCLVGDDVVERVKLIVDLVNENDRKYTIEFEEEYIDEDFNKEGRR